MAIAHWFTFALECTLASTNAGELRAQGELVRTLDVGGHRYERTQPVVAVSANAVTVRRSVNVPRTGLLGQLRTWLAGPCHVEDLFSVPVPTGASIQEGDLLRASRGPMGTRHVVVQRTLPDGSAHNVFQFDDLEHTLGKL